MKLYVVPTNHVYQYWDLAEPLLQKALDKGNGEFTAEPIKTISHTRATTTVGADG